VKYSSAKYVTNFTARVARVPTTNLAKSIIIVASPVPPATKIMEATKGIVDSEKLIEKTLAAEVKKLGGWSLKLLSTYVTGLPDRLVLLPGGVVFFVEVKTTGKKPTTIQRVVHEKLRGLGFRVEVVDSLKQLNLILNNLLE